MSEQPEEIPDSMRENPVGGCRGAVNAALIVVGLAVVIWFVAWVALHWRA